jgi:mannose-1-phosphate guanylyltransferase
MVHQIEALARAGVTEVILAVSHQPEALAAAVRPIAERIGVKVTVSMEDPKTPLGTAGPIGLARKILVPDGTTTATAGEPFFVLNSDVVCSYPFAEMLQYHRERGAQGTILVTKVDDPSKYGVVVYEQRTGKIDRFVEKPKEFVGDRINAGAYVLQPSVLDLIEPRRMSIEREVFPKIAAKGTLYAMPLEGFWADVGQPRDFIRGTDMFLAWLASGAGGQQRKDEVVAYSEELAAKGGWKVVQPVLIDHSAIIGEGAEIGPNVVLGPGTRVGKCARLRETTLLGGARVGDAAWVNKAIIGWSSTVGRWARIDEGTVLAENVHIADELYINGALVLPHKDITASIPSPSIVM